MAAFFDDDDAVIPRFSASIRSPTFQVDNWEGLLNESRPEFENPIFKKNSWSIFYSK